MVDISEPTEAQALLTITRICGPIKIIYRGDTQPWLTNYLREYRREVIRWLKETSIWIKTPPMRW